MFNVNLLKQDHFSHAEANTKVDILTSLAKHFSSLDSTGKGTSYYSITPKCAQWMLHVLKHEELTQKGHTSVFHISRTLSKEGIKSIKPSTPMVICTDTNTIISGRTRLYGVAMSKKGTFLEIELI
jgi:hypothetical protein